MTLENENSRGVVFKSRWHFSLGVSNGEDFWRALSRVGGTMKVSSSPKARAKGATVVVPIIQGSVAFWLGPEADEVCTISIRFVAIAN